MFGTKTAAKLAKTLEESAAKWWDRTLRAPRTLTGLGRVLGGASSVKERWDRSLEQAWSAWRLPSALDVERLHERIGELEEHLSELNVQLETFSTHHASAPTAAGNQS